jgi:hypothetical protein
MISDRSDDLIGVAGQYPRTHTVDNQEMREFD